MQLVIREPRNMQDLLHKLAQRLSPLQPLVVTGAITALLAALLIAVNPGHAGERFLVPAILAACWCVLVFTLVNLFSASPPVVDRSQGLLRRLQVSLQRLFRQLLALCFLGLTAALLLMSYRLLTTGVG